ncbi:hypothetical protein SAMN05444358_101129 [Ruegeria halocynthiae]|uniref:Uncharacterized protein n=1 Tax=Ruegeria halocynthiae TaxID=985054 RepID=A0A1H2RFH8_9RHOB|nr:hypothetical protein [Ruegeria halocynthiae]SDW17584.1 hypothetical protein SAMN05444358_101129 [Ruegeria halocynthiae]
MVLYSAGKVDYHSQLSALAVFETIAASIFGLILVWWGVYWVLWTSIFLTFLVHLRSEDSIEDGVAIFNRSWERLSKTNASQRFFRVTVVFAVAIGVSWTFWFAPILLDRFGWTLGYQRLVLLGFLSLNITIATVVFVTILAIVILTERRPVASTNDGPSEPSSKRTIFYVLIGLTILLPGAVVSVTGCFIIIRAFATLKHLRKGISRFLQNWTTLMLKTDITTEPELLPGLPSDHTFSFQTFFFQFRADDQSVSEKYGNLLALTIFIPPMFYRLILKSTFWFYAPLMWAAAPPRGLEQDQSGRLKWNPTLARTPVDIAAALIALIGAFLFFFRLWDYSAYQDAAAWAKDNDFPAYWPLLAAGLNPAGLNIWYLLPGVSALLSLVVFVWAMQISSRVRLLQRFPDQLTLWCLYKLNAAKNFLSISTVLVGFCFLLVYYSSSCLLPSALQSAVSALNITECGP